MISVDEIRHELAGDRPVYVVRCRECRHSMYDQIFDIYYCAKLTGKRLTPDFFCAWGERKEQNDEN
jgi:hypothetical protein